MEMRPISLMAASAAALFSTIVGAAPCRLPGWAGWDLNRDGRVTQQELDRSQETRWAHRAAEGRLLRHANRARQFATLDRDGDGHLNTAEVPTHLVMRPCRMGRQCAKRQYTALSSPRLDCPNRDIAPGLVASPAPKNCPNRLIPAGLMH